VQFAHDNQPRQSPSEAWELFVLAEPISVESSVTLIVVRTPAIAPYDALSALYI
jgi:hypothetical protein